MPIRFSWKPGITWTETGKSAGRFGMASSKVLDDLWASPEAVPTLMGGGVLPYLYLRGVIG